MNMTVMLPVKGNEQIQAAASSDGSVLFTAQAPYLGYRFTDPRPEAKYSDRPVTQTLSIDVRRQESLSGQRSRVWVGGERQPNPVSGWSHGGVRVAMDFC